MDCYTFLHIKRSFVDEARMSLDGILIYWETEQWKKSKNVSGYALLLNDQNTVWYDNCITQI